MRPLIAALLFVLACTVPASAADLCVKTGGSDATVKASIVYVAGNEAGSTCWATIGRSLWGNASRSSPSAAQAATAGDTVHVFGGSYNFAGTLDIDEFEGLYRAVNTGTVGNYLAIVCVGDCTISAPDLGGPIIGVGDTAATTNDFIKWFADISQGHSWIMNSCALASGCAAGTIRILQDTGPVTCQGQDGVWFEGMVITSVNNPPSDNYSGIRLQGCNDALVRNNVISNFQLSGNPLNGHASAIQLYVTEDGIFEHNHLTSCGGGFSIKDQPTINLPSRGNIFRFNLIENVGDALGVFNSSENTLDDGNRFYQNVVNGYFHGHNFTGTRNDWFFNNTFYNGNLGLPPAMINFPGIAADPGVTDDGVIGLRLWNNIVHTTGYAIFAEGAHSALSNDAAIDFEHNVYFMFSEEFYGSETDGERTFTSFKAAYTTQDQANSPAGTASVNQDPLLANPAGGDYRLCTSAGVPHASCSGASPAINRGVDLGDLDGDLSTTDAINAGAYVTGNEVVGLNGAAQGGGSASPGKGKGRMRMRGKEAA